MLIQLAFLAVAAFSTPSQFEPRPHEWHFEVTSRASLPGADRPYGPLTFGEWCVLSFVDHPYTVITGKPSCVGSKEALYKVDEVKKLLDTDEVLDAINSAYRGPVQPVSGFGAAIAVAYVSHTLGGSSGWQVSHQKCVASALSELEIDAKQGEGAKFDLKCGIARLALARMSHEPLVRQKLLRSVVSSASGEYGFLALNATLELCRESIEANHIDEAHRLADVGVKTFGGFNLWINFLILQGIQRQGARGLAGYIWL